MRQDERTAFDRALDRARRSAYAPGDFVGQESFMRAGEILSLAVRAGVAPGVSVVDLCCGVAGPGRFITAALGCSYLGVDTSPTAVALAEGGPLTDAERSTMPDADSVWLVTLDEMLASLAAAGLRVTWSEECSS